MTRQTPYFAQLRQRIQELGGLFNAHLHLDRSGTYDETRRLLDHDGDDGVSHLSLSKKHSLIPAIHASRCYEPEELRRRADGFLDMLVDAGTRRADTVVDVTADRVGLGALEQFMVLKAERRGELDLRVGAYSPLGFRDDEPERWELLAEGAKHADFIGTLPERDDLADYPEHIGFEENCRRMLQLCADLDKPLHIHVDQKNLPSEAASEWVVRVAAEMNLSAGPGAEPLIWLVHVISPSTYDEGRFDALLASLAEMNIGVICCPSAAISMRQYRPIQTPTSNSIARVLEMLAAGVHVRVGSDNLCDITSPASSPDLVDELFVLGNAVRYYDLDALAKLGAGQRLDEHDIARLHKHLEEDRREVARVVGRHLETARR